MKKVILLSAVILSVFSCIKKPSFEDYNSIEIKKISADYQKGKTEFNENEEEIYNIFQDMVKIPLFVERYKNINAIYVTIIDETNKPTAGITVISDGNEISLEKGYNTSLEPFTVIYVTKKYALDAYEIFSDNKITDEEEFRIANLFLIPTLEAVFKSRDFIYFTKIKYFRFDTPLFFTLKNPTGFKLKPEEDFTKVTIIKDNDNYKVIRGHSGIKKDFIKIPPKATPVFFKIFIQIYNEKDFNEKTKLYKKLYANFIKEFLKSKKK